MQPIFVSSNPQEPTNWRAVCGRTARTVRREGRPNSIGRPYPYLWLRLRRVMLKHNLQPRVHRRPTKTICSRITGLVGTAGEIIMFGLGIAEIIIIAVVGLLCLGLPIGIVLAIVLAKRKDE